MFVQYSLAQPVKNWDHVADVADGKGRIEKLFLVTVVFT